MKTAILVLGAHRSGTSAFTRMLNLLGVDLPARLYPAGRDNVLGFWEPAEVLEIHTEILAGAGSSWDDWRRFDPAWYDSPPSRMYADRLLAWLARDFGSSDLFVLKDPRMCRLFRLWRQVLGEFGAEIKVVIALRNPLEVARSLAARNGFGLTRSALIWLRHMLDAVLDTRHVPRCVVAYDDLLGDWRKVAAEIGERLEVTWPRSFSEVESEIDAFLSPRQRHHVVRDDQWLDEPSMGDWVKRAYHGLTALTAKGPHDSAEATLDALRSELDTAIAALSPLGDELRDEVGRLGGELGQRGRRLVAADGELRRLIADIEEREGRLRAAGDEIRRLVDEVTARDRRLVDADRDMRRQITETGARDQKLAAADTTVHRLIRERAEGERQADTEIRRLRAEVQERDGRLQAADGELRRLIGEVGARDQRLVAADREMRHLIDALGTRDQRLSEVDGELRSLIGEVQRLVGEVGARDQRLLEVDGELRGLIGEVQRLVAEVEDRDWRLVTAEEELSRVLLGVARRDEDLITLEGRLAATVDELRGRDRRLAAVEQRLHGIETSRAWRLARLIRRLLGRSS